MWTFAEFLQFREVTTRWQCSTMFNLAPCKPPNFFCLQAKKNYHYQLLLNQGTHSHFRTTDSSLNAAVWSTSLLKQNGAAALMLKQANSAVTAVTWWGATLLLHRRRRVYSADRVSQHDCLKTDLMNGLKRISRVLMNMVGWTMYRALMFFLYLETKERGTFQLVFLVSFSGHFWFCTGHRGSSTLFLCLLTLNHWGGLTESESSGLSGWWETSAFLYNKVCLLTVTQGGAVLSDHMQIVG